MAKGVLAMNNTNEISLEEKARMKMGKSLENIFKTCEQRSNKLVALVQTPIYGALAFYGEHLQGLAEKGIRPYDWFTGHLSDFFAAAATTSFYSFIILNGSPQEESSFNKKLYYGVPIVSAMLWSCFEFLELSQDNTKFDIQDIACFWAGSFMAAYGIKLFGKQINDIFKKKEIVK